MIGHVHFSVKEKKYNILWQKIHSIVSAAVSACVVILPTIL